MKLLESRRAEKLIDYMDTIWLYKHCMSGALSAGDEFNRRTIQNALSERAIKLKPRPGRRHQKCGVAERKNGTVKRIVERLTKADNTSSNELIIAKAVFLSNCLDGSKFMRSF